nr:MAG TPA: hypothetical protein [Caudoviricetes sp.]
MQRVFKKDIYQCSAEGISFGRRNDLHLRAV